MALFENQAILLLFPSLSFFMMCIKIIARGDYREVKIIFYNLSENEKEDAERLHFDLYKGKLDEGPVNPETLVLKYGTDEEVLKFVSTGDVGRKTEEFLIEKCDREKISAYLKNKRVFSVSDQLASVVISMGLVELLITKTLSDKMASPLLKQEKKKSSCNTQKDYPLLWGKKS